MARPDRQRKRRDDPNLTRGQISGGKKFVQGDPRIGNAPDPRNVNPLAQPQFFEDRKTPAGFDPMGDIQNQQKKVDKIRQDRDLRQQLLKKQQEKRKSEGFRKATDRRSSRRSGRRVFRDPNNLQRFASAAAEDREKRRFDTPVTTSGTNQPADMDDTIVGGPDGQQFRYDSEIDGFTPVNFNPKTNRYDYGGPESPDGATSGTADMAKGDDFKVAQKSFDKQMGELRGLADTDQQFGEMYQDLQSEYMSILREPNLRPEERNAALQDLFDRGSSTFELTSGFARAQKEQEAMAEQQEAKAKLQEQTTYRNRRALEAKDEIRRKQEEARYEDRKTRQKYSETTQSIDAAYKAHKEGVDAFNESGDGMANPKNAMSLEEFTQQHYEKMVQDKKLGEQVQKTDVDISLIETEIGQLQDEDPMEYRAQLTTIYGQGRQDAADAAFQHHLDQRSAKIAGLQRKKSQLKTLREGLIDQQGEIYEAKRSTPKSQGERKAFFSDAVMESRQQEKDARTSIDTGVVGGLKKETREIARGSEKISTRELRLERDAQGKATNVNSPEFIRDMTGDSTMLGKLRRLAQAQGDEKLTGKYYGDDQGMRNERIKMLQKFEDMLENEPPAEGQEDLSLRERASLRLDDVLGFEKSLGEEQVGSRGQPKQRFDAEDESVPASIRFGGMGLSL